MSIRSRTSQKHVLSTVVPGFAPAAPKRNVLVVLAYCFVLLFVFALAF